MNIDNDKIAERLPPSLNRTNLREVAQVVDEELQKINALSELTLIYPRIDELSSDLVDALALSLHVDYYDASLPLDTRRALVKNSTRWHMRKGTKGVVAEMVETVWGGCVVEEWFEYSGKPFHFRVINVTASHVDQDTISMVLRAITLTKNVRSWLDEIWFLRKLDVPTYYAVVPTYHKCHVVSPRKAEDGSIDITPYLGISRNIHKAHVVSPRRLTSMRADITAYAAGHSAYHKRIVLGKNEE